MSLGGGVGGPGDKGLKLNLADTFRLAWADPDLRQRLKFVIFVFTIYVVGVHVPVPIPGFSPDDLKQLLQDNPFFGMMNTIGGGAFSRMSIFALGLGPYISASIIMQVLTMGNPKWKKELQEGGEYARKQQNRRTRILTVGLCLVQGFSLLQFMAASVPTIADMSLMIKFEVAVFWLAGAMFLLWLGEQVSEKGIGNGISLMIFAGIVISLPSVAQLVTTGVANGIVAWWQAVLIVVMFVATTWFIVMFTIAQRRIPIQHMRRNMGTRAMGGRTSYLPISVNMAGVIPVIFAIALIYMPAQFAMAFPVDSTAHTILTTLGEFFSPNFRSWKGWIGAGVYMALIFFFTYFWNAMTYNVEDIANNLKRGGSYIPGVRPGKQTKEFLDGVVSKVTFVGALFLSIVALTQFVFPLIANIPNLGLIGGTSLLIMVSVALETMRQIEASILIRQYES